MAAAPTVDDLLAYLGGGSYPRDQAAAALDAALETQAAVCVVLPYTAALREAALRRAQTILVARGAPLGQIDTGAFGATPMMRYDPEVGRLEADYLRGGFA